MTEQSSEATVSMALQRMSLHLDMLAGQIFEVEEALSHLLQRNGDVDALPISRFQALDFTRQSLEDCALLLNHLSCNQTLTTEYVDQVEVSSKLKLSSTRELAASSSMPSVDNAVGEVDFL
jgi:hypothetical protein